MNIQFYQFFDQLIALSSNHAETMVLMEAMFRRLAVDDLKNNPLTRQYKVVANDDGTAQIHTPDSVYEVEQTTLLPSLTHGIVLGHTLAQIRSHLLFHAAALSKHEKGLILAADSGCGKTTLALALVRQGFKLLSDEAAALGRHFGELAPYPRCLWVRSGTEKVFQQYGWPLPPHQIALKKEERKAIHLASTQQGETCQPRYLIIIKRPDKAEERLCDFTLDKLPDNLLTDLQTIGIAQIKAPTKKQFPVIKAKEADLNQIYAACEQHNVLVLDVDEAAIEPSYYQQLPDYKKYPN
jgi:DNA polymerase III delta prime subunit